MKNTKPISGKDFLAAFKKAISAKAKWCSFRWINPPNEGNGTQPLQFDGKTDIGTEGNVFIFGGITGSTLGKSSKFEDHFVWSLKYYYEKNGKKLSAILNKCNQVGVKYGKEFLPVVKVELGVGTEPGQHFIIWIGDLEKSEEQKNEDWI